MGYYMGDFYRGYRGDPGFFSFLGGLAKKAVGFIPGVGPALSAGISAVGSLKKGSAMVKAVAAPMVTRGVGAVMRHPVLSAAGAAGAVMTAAGAAHMVHRGSSAAAGMAAPMAGGHMVGGRRKRMNVCNPKALRRAIRRTHGFAKLAMKTIHLVHPKKHVTFGGFRKRRKKK